MVGQSPERPIQADDIFLAEVLAQLHRRSKSRKHKNISLEIDRVIELSEQDRIERIDLRFECGLRHPIARFSVTLWSNRTLWLQASEPKHGSHGGWKYTLEDSGRLMPNLDSRKLVELFEESISRMSGMTEASVSKLTNLWQPYLAKGPNAL